jgi:serine/threonine protein kinase
MQPGVEALDEHDPKSLGPYALLGRIGDGGMGTVYLARREEDERLVAVKMIRGDLARQPMFRSRFLREAQAAQRVARFCTAEVLDVSTEGRWPYLVTEFIDGPTVSTVIAERGPLPAAELERLAVTVASALIAIHAAGVVHRDLKPGNILLSSSGARVIDFGIARALDATTMLTAAGTGTPAFMAPEQALGRPVTAAADIYAWGGVVLYAGTGRLPHGRGATPVVLYRAVNEEPDLTGLDDGLRPLVEQAMVKDPARRPTAHDLLLRLTGSRPTIAMTTVPGPEEATPLVDQPGSAAGRGERVVARASAPPAARASVPPAGEASAPPAAKVGPAPAAASSDAVPEGWRGWFYRPRFVVAAVLAIVAITVVAMALSVHSPN